MEKGVLRIIDANLNRAREALRVMEEYARFVLEDASLAAAIKAARHEMREIADCQLPSGDSAGEEEVHQDAPYHFGNCRLPIGDCENVESKLSDFKSSGAQSQTSDFRFLAARDTPGDVGMGIEGGHEYERGSVQDVVLAAGKRLSEALRVLEEYGKLVGSRSETTGGICATDSTKEPRQNHGAGDTLARRAERLRYQGYEIERRLALSFRARERFGGVRLYVILTEAHCTCNWFETAESALRGGAQVLQLREKKLADCELLERGRRLATLCRQYGALFIMNDRPDLAIACGAHGVHLGQDDIPVTVVRGLLPPHLLIGISTHTIVQVTEAIAATPDYIAVGPIFQTDTKPQPHVAGLELLNAARRLTSLPLVAIGGIVESNIESVREAGDCATCVCSAVISQRDPESAARRLVERHSIPR